jgi:capsular exopolysaccharide synthesis family protein
LSRAATGESAPDSALDSALGTLQRRWRTILASILLVAAVAYAYSSRQEKQYATTASILFQKDVEAVANSGNDFVDPEREAATNEALLELPVVANDAARILGRGITPGQVAGAITVESSRESDIVDIKATTADPDLSVRMVNAYGRAFIDFRRTGARNRIDEALEGARAALKALTATERDGPPGVEVRQRINQLETTRSLQTGGADLVQLGARPNEPSAPKPLRSGILGAILGAILGFALATLRERRDSTVKRVEDFEAAFGRPVIAEIPRSRSLARAGMEPLGPEESEAFRMLRSSLRYFSVDFGRRSLLIASASTGEGKSTVARRLAETMAAMGDSVVLVEADMHRPSGFSFGQGSERLGLSTVLIGHDLDDSLAEFPLEPGSDGERRALAVLPNGPAPPNPSELLDSDRMREVLRLLHEQFDMIILDSPPLPVLSDALPLISQVDGVLAISAVGQTKRDGIRDFLRLVGLHDGDLLGVVVNFAARSDRSAAAYYRQPPSGGRRSRSAANAPIEAKSRS